MVTEWVAIAYISRCRMVYMYLSMQKIPDGLSNNALKNTWNVWRSTTFPAFTMRNDVFEEGWTLRPELRERTVGVIVLFSPEKLTPLADVRQSVLCLQ